VWCPELGAFEIGHGKAFKAMSHQDAAEAWAKHEDWSSADYSIASGRHTYVVHVQGPEGEVRRFRVSGEAVTHYTAERLP
jgi:hypothetical protein